MTPGGAPFLTHSKAVLEAARSPAYFYLGLAAEGPILSARPAMELSGPAERRAGHFGGEEVQNRPPQDVLLWHVNFLR